MRAPDLLEDRIRDAGASPRTSLDVDALWDDGLRARRRRRTRIAGVSIAAVAVGVLVVPELVGEWAPRVSTRPDAVGGDGSVPDAPTGQPTAACADPEVPSSLMCPHWQREASGSLLVPPVVEGSDVFVSMSDRLVALDVTTGATAWTLELENPVLERPAVSRERVFVSDSTGQLTSLDRETGERQWKVPVGPTRTPVVAGETVVVASVDRLVGLSVVDGSQRWVVPMRGELSSPVVVSAMALVGDGDGVIHAVDTVAGELTWEAEADNGSHLVLDADDDVVVASGFDRPVVGLDRTSGERLWTSETNAGSPAPRFVPGGQVVQAMRDGRVLAFDAREGTSSEVATVFGAREVIVGPEGLLYVVEGDGDATAWTPGGQQVWSTDTRIDSLAVGGTRDEPWMVAVDQGREGLVGLPAPPWEAE